MLQRWMTVSALVLLVTGAAVAQTLFYRLGPAQPAGNGPKWEYLVVAERRPTFHLSVAESTMQPLSQSGNDVPFVLEARALEGRLNEIGEAGWELVAVLGAVGGDQQYVFKRARR